MITPNKFICFDKSVLSKLQVIMDYGDREVEISELLENTISKFEDLNQFIFTLDVLYILGKIEIDFEARTMKYVN